MRIQKLLLSLLLAAGMLAPSTGVYAAKGPDDKRPAKTTDERLIDFRANCDNAVTQYDMEVNNVRARLTTGGDVWFDGTNGRYVVPKPPPGVPEVSSIFAGAVWLGGRDPGGGLNVAAQDYGRGSGSFDYYPGPLTEEGTVEADTCARWDRMFTVTGEEIREFLALYQQAVEEDALPLNPDVIPTGVLGWPALGNEFFSDIYPFQLPDAPQGLAGFWDQDFDGFYDPTQGDYPIIEIRGCNQTPQFPEEMTFFIYNDAGNVHRQSGTPNQIQMEIQVQAFAYTSSDDINNMSFMRYKLINRAQEDILDTYFAMWLDPDLGCSEDDYVGADTTRSLAYVYNEDELDGSNGCTCPQGVATYCDEVPILGVDYFRGPRGVFDGVEVELGMSSFMYFNRGGLGAPDATTDPGTADEYYSYLQGRWRDGTPLFATDDGYQDSGPTTRYAFPSAPDDERNNAWSMCAADLPFGDRRTIQASGPFTLNPGAVNELIVGVVWVPDQNYPCPSLRRLQQADDLAQSLFDNCFDMCDGPDAPDVDIVELDQEVILLLSNPPASNNTGENYEELGLGIPRGEDSLYRFEGYRIFQFAGPNVSLADIDDPERVREVAQFDIQNGVTRVFNWNGLVEEDENPLTEPYFVPELQVNGNDQGIRHTVRITNDAFASGGDTRLINHRRYYFTAIAYGYNNFKEYDPFDQADPGQPQQYKSSSRNIGDRLTGDPFYTAIPRPTLDRELFAEYGDGAVITRLSGQGNNGNFLDLTDETVSEVEAAFAAGELQQPELTYDRGAAPIDVFVANPREIRDGEYELTFIDDDMTDDDLEENTMWTLRSLSDPGLPVVVSESPISRDNEQIVSEYGFSVRIGDVPEPGSDEAIARNNGAIGANVSYDDPDGDRWLNFIPDNLTVRTGITQLDNELFNYVNTERFARFEDEDPNQDLTEMSPGIYPLHLMNWEQKPSGVPYLSPIYLSTARHMQAARRAMDLEDLRNVNIVFTSDKNLWTRTPVIETSNFFYTQFTYDGRPFKTEDDPLMFELRDSPSVTREAGPDGLPAVDTDEEREFGMGWFPGYAVDVETGERLQVIWGENSLYDGRTFEEENFTAQTNGNDMIWNPSSVILDPVVGIQDLSIYDFVAGGQHYFYVLDQVYDEGEFAAGRFRPVSANSNRKVRAVQRILWAGFPLLNPGSSLRSYAEGIIPNDVTVKLRVNNSFGFSEGTEGTTGYPTYRFSLDGAQANTTIDEAAVNRVMDAINVVPNPYYGFSTYEDTQFETNIKITNLPPRATVSIYTLDGKFIRKYNRDETPTMLRGDTRPVGMRQIAPALEWDLRNQAGIPVASGVYLIHVDAPGFGERTLKFFGVQRQFDPSGL